MLKYQDKIVYSLGVIVGVGLGLAAVAPLI